MKASTAIRAATNAFCRAMEADGRACSSEASCWETQHGCEGVSSIAAAVRAAAEKEEEEQDGNA